LNKAKKLYFPADNILDLNSKILTL